MTITTNCTTVDTSGQIHYICVTLHTWPLLSSTSVRQCTYSYHPLPR